MTGDVSVTATPRSAEMSHSLSPATRRLTFAVLSVGVVTYSLVQSLLVPVLAEIQYRLDTTQVGTSWVLTAYLLSASISTPLLGRIGDAVGKKKMLVFALGCLSVGSLIAAAAPSIGWLILARVIQGMGGGVLPVSFGILRDRYPAHRLGTAVALLTSLTAAGFGCGVVLAGPIVHILGYRWLFLLPMIVTTIAMLGAIRFVPESRTRQPGGVPVLPAVLLGGWLVSLLLAVTQADNWGWGSATIRALLGTALVLAVVWILVERRAKVPLIDLTMMRRRGIWTCNVVALLAGFGTFTAYGFLPQFFQTPESTGYGLGATITQAGLLLLPTPAFSFLLGMRAAWFVGRTSIRRVLCFGAALTGSAFVLFSLFHDQPGLIYFWAAIQGSGAGLSFSTLAAAVLLAAPLQQSGVASGMNANIRTIGGAIGTAVAAAILAVNDGPGGFPTERGYIMLFVVIAGAFFVASVMSLLVPTPRVAGAYQDPAVATAVPARSGGEAVP